MIESVRGADLVVLVTEPTPFGLHDLKLAVETVRQLGGEPCVVLNRYGIGDGKVEEYCADEGIELIARIPNSRLIAETCAGGQLLIDGIPEAAEAMRLVARFIGSELEPRAYEGDRGHIREGRTGKTSLTAAFAMLAGPALVVADCDVDAADMHLLMQPDFAHAQDFFSGQRAVIDKDRCSGCGACAAVCRFQAITVNEGRFLVDGISCEGCGYCARVCPESAIADIEQNVGQWYRSGIRNGSTMVHARLRVGAGNSGKLVARVKNEARAVATRDGKSLVLVDGSPGLPGRPLSLSGASLGVLGTEPTVSGLHDLRRVHELVRKFGLRCACVLNKADLNPEVRLQLLRFLEDRGITLLAEIPYDEQFTAAITHGRTLSGMGRETRTIASRMLGEGHQLVADD